MKLKTKKNDDEKQKGQQCNTNRENANSRMPNFKIILVCAVCCGMVNMFHISSMFENDRHFSHLSNLEREMTFRTEMGFYYSFYKDIVEAGSFLSGLNKLLYNNKTEYPDTINSVQRFNLYPEILIGGAYRAFSQVIEHLDLELPKICWKVSKGDDQNYVISCEGIGDPFYWYLNAVWLSAGMSAALIFVHGCQLSYSLIGGFLAVMCFFFNHAEATRVQWAPPLRESFGFPWSIALNIIATRIVRLKNASWMLPFIYGTFSLKYLLCWQLSQYTLVIHILIAYIMYSIRMIPAFPMLLILLGAFYAFFNNLVLQFGNSLLLTSPLAGVLVGILLLYVFMEPVIQYFPFPMNIAMQLSCVFISTVASKLEISRMLSIEDDSHIINIAKAKFSNYSDFHTLLYTCSAEFDFLPYDTYSKLSATLLLPCVILMVGCLVTNTLSFIRENFAKRIHEKVRSTNIWEGIDCGVIFNVFLLSAYAIMATLVMRLKVFFTPQLCVIASLLASRKYWGHILTRKIHVAVIACLVAAMSVKGFENIIEQRSIIGEYNNPNLDHLIHWVNDETGPNSVFAGPMPTMANLMLSTGRPIVNHPHYENLALRERTKSVYSVFSRKTPHQVYETLLSLKVNYVVLMRSWCFGRNKPGCSMVDLWDKEDPQNKQKQPLCPKLFERTPSPFRKVFWNDEYVVLEVPSKYIEIPPPRILSE